MMDTIQVRTMAIHSHVLTLVSKAPKISLKKRNVMSVVVACVILNLDPRRCARRPMNSRRAISSLWRRDEARCRP